MKKQKPKRKYDHLKKREILPMVYEMEDRLKTVLAENEKLYIENKFMMSEVVRHRRVIQALEEELEEKTIKIVPDRRKSSGKGKEGKDSGI